MFSLLPQCNLISCGWVLNISILPKLHYGLLGKFGWRDFARKFSFQNLSLSSNDDLPNSLSNAVV